MSGPSSPSNLSSVTLIGSTGSGGQERQADDTPTDTNSTQFKYGRAPTSPLPERIRRPSCHRDTLKEEEAEQVHSTTTTSVVTMTTLITHPPPPLVMTTPCGGGGGMDGRVRGGSLKVDSQITINLPKPTTGGGQCQQTLSISPPHVALDRRPSVGANVIPQAALCQHRHSLQLNGVRAMTAADDDPLYKHCDFRGISSNVCPCFCFSE